MGSIRGRVGNGLEGWEGLNSLVFNRGNGLHNWGGESLDSNGGWGGMDSDSGLGNSVSDSLDLLEGGVGNSLGLQKKFIKLTSIKTPTHGGSFKLLDTYSNNGFLGQDGSLLNDGLGDVFGGDNLAGGDMGNGCGFMDHSGFSNGVGDGRNLGGHLSVGMGLSDSVGKVATQPVRFDGGRVMGWGSDQSGGQSSWGWGSYQGKGLLGHGGTTGKGQKASKNDKSLKC